MQKSTKVALVFLGLMTVTACVASRTHAKPPTDTVIHNEQGSVSTGPGYVPMPPIPGDFFYWVWVQGQTASTPRFVNDVPTSGGVDIDLPPQ